MKIPLSILSVFLTLSLSIPSYAEIVFYDLIALKGETLMLKAKTGGRFFSKGGEIVEFSVNGKSIGKSLSGGDGYAFKEFTPTKAGTYKISTISGKDKDNGCLLSLLKGDRIVFIDVEGSIFAPFSNEPKKDSQKVIRAISKRFPVIYLQTGMYDVRAIKKLFEKNEFPVAPVLSWGEGAVFDEINKKGLRIKFIIGSASVIESAKDFKPKAFSFDEVEGAVEVKDWEEIWKKMKVIK